MPQPSKTKAGAYALHEVNESHNVRVLCAVAGSNVDSAPSYMKDKKMNYLSRLEDEVSAWPNVSVHPHRFGGKEFRFGKAEIGHVHRDGTVDIPFPRAVRDALLEEGSGRRAPLGPKLRVDYF